MSDPKCPVCKTSTFVLEKVEVKGSITKFVAVVCAKCGSIISMSESYIIDENYVPDPDVKKQRGFW